MEQYEAAADIVFSIDGVEIPIASVDTSKDVTIEQIRGNNVRPIGYAITEVEYSGTLTFEGNGYLEEIDDVVSTDEDVSIDDYQHLEDFFTNDDGLPKDGANVTIFHENDNKQTTYEDVMVGSDSYETETSDFSGVTFEFIAGNRNREDVE